jgi:hypothetical protein
MPQMVPATYASNSESLYHEQFRLNLSTAVSRRTERVVALNKAARAKRIISFACVFVPLPFFANFGLK